LKALEAWPAEGIPQAPDAWLLAVAKRQLLQVARHDRVRFDPAVTVLFEHEGTHEAPPDIPDARLKLMFVCAHPAIDEKVRTPHVRPSARGYFSLLRGVPVVARVGRSKGIAGLDDFLPGSASRTSLRRRGFRSPATPGCSSVESRSHHSSRSLLMERCAATPAWTITAGR